MKHVVYGVLTRYVRFLPETHQGGVCMRTEVFGVKQKPSECETFNGARFREYMSSTFYQIGHLVT